MTDFTPEEEQRIVEAVNEWIAPFSVEQWAEITLSAEDVEIIERMLERHDHRNIRLPRDRKASQPA